MRCRSGTLPAFSFLLISRIKADSGNVNSQGIDIETSHNAYVDYASGKEDMVTVAQAMATDITNALSSGQLSAAEVNQLQGVLAGLTGDAELAEAYVEQVGGAGCCVSTFPAIKKAPRQDAFCNAALCNQAFGRRCDGERCRGGSDLIDRIQRDDLRKIGVAHVVAINHPRVAKG